VIFLTAIDDEVNVVMGLDMGADDYITKPFRIKELLSRIKSVLRRYDKTEFTKTLINFSCIKIDTAHAKLYKGEQEIVLTSLEYRLLIIFANNQGQVLSRNQLLECHLICDESLPKDKRQEFSQNIRSQLERLKWLVASLLNISKIDAGTIELKKENVNVEKLISRATQHLLISMEIKEQTFEISGDDHTEFIGDFNWSAEAATNIIKNCVEHTPSGGNIDITFCETPIYTIIKIFDNGEGIHKEDLPQIFNRFYKGINAHNDSIGIGLAMSKIIFQKQGGTIEVNSEKDKGTEFTIKIYKSVV
jgi:signal transduction histidine kinase